MVRVVLGDWAYRIRQDGIVESTKFLHGDDYKPHTPAETGLEDGQMWHIREHLKRLSEIFPNGWTPKEVVKEPILEPELSGIDLR